MVLADDPPEKISLGLDVDGGSRKKQILVRVLIFFGLQLSLFLAVLDEYGSDWITLLIEIYAYKNLVRTIVATTLPKIGSDF